ncbi:MAG: radical SAM protein [Intestinibacter bartlettii]|uniref:radical SAM protein n=1 Tax=Intestinibacter bartlettii TaxID=261299 RepID=UPI00399A68AF
MIILPISIDIRITAKCNLTCDFCFGSNCKSNVLEFNKLIFLLKKFKVQGVRYLVVTGGEPFTYKHIYEFLEYAKSLGFMIVLSTNGLLINDVSKLDNIDILSLPLDGENYKSLKKNEEYDI